MLQLLVMVFIAIGVVCCEPNCPIYSQLQNDPSLLPELDGTEWYKVFSTTTTLDACQRQTFTFGPNNTPVEAYVKSKNWCLHMSNWDLSNPDHYENDIYPVTSVTIPTLPSLQRNSVKLVRQIGIGDSQCILYTYCRIGAEGLYLLCRELPQFLFTLLLQIINLLASLLNIFTPVPVLKQINQANCIFLNTCPP